MTGLRIAAQANFPVYFIDDETAIRVIGEKTDIVSEGRWRFTHSSRSARRRGSRL